MSHRAFPQTFAAAKKRERVERVPRESPAWLEDAPRRLRALMEFQDGQGMPGGLAGSGKGLGRQEGSEGARAGTLHA